MWVHFDRIFEMKIIVDNSLNLQLLNPYAESIELLIQISIIIYAGSYINNESNRNMRIICICNNYNI